MKRGHENSLGQKIIFKKCFIISVTSYSQCRNEILINFVRKHYFFYKILK